jgi:hypothetical protein
MSASVLSDEQTGPACGVCGFDVLLNHEISSFFRERPDPSFRRVRRLESSFGPRSTGLQPDHKLGRQTKSERDHQEHADTAEHLQRRRRVDFAGIVSIELEMWGIFISGLSRSVP